MTAHEAEMETLRAERDWLRTWMAALDGSFASHEGGVRVPTFTSAAVERRRLKWLRLQRLSCHQRRVQASAWCRQCPVRREER